MWGLTALVSTFPLLMPIYQWMLLITTDDLQVNVPHVAGRHVLVTADRLSGPLRFPLLQAVGPLLPLVAAPPLLLLARVAQPSGGCEGQLVRIVLAVAADPHPQPSMSHPPLT